MRWRRPSPPPGGGVRETVAPIERDRPRGDGIERLAERVAAGEFDTNAKRRE